MNTLADLRVLHELYFCENSFRNLISFKFLIEINFSLAKFNTGLHKKKLKNHSKPCVNHFKFGILRNYVFKGCKQYSNFNNFCQLIYKSNDKTDICFN